MYWNDGTEGKVVSTTQMGKLLAQWGFVDRPFTARDLKKDRPKNVTHETYGRTSCLYVRCKSPEDRKKLERRLGNEGLRFNDGYWPGSSIVEVTVSYFKGWHWDE